MVMYVHSIELPLKWCENGRIKLDVKGKTEMAYFTGYHATHRSRADQIASSQHFNRSTGDEHWLGDGVYFFDDERWAKWWCTKRHIPASQWACVECYITVADDRTLDLRSEDGKDALRAAYDALEELSRRKGHPIQTERQYPTDGAAINYLAESLDYKVVIGEFSVLDGDYPESRLLRQTQVQISVRDDNCLSGFRKSNMKAG